MKSVWVVGGTRPEIIKLAPVYRALSEMSGLRTRWLATGQHTSLALQALQTFAIEPDLTLPAHPQGRADDGQKSLPPRSVAGMLSELIHLLDVQFSIDQPSLVVVQGDTTSAMAAALAAFSRQIPVAHVEAGLRTFNLAQPFPEEGWRSVIGQLASLHFAPTETAAQNLDACGVPGERIHVTGNTVIDALYWLLKNEPVEYDDPMPATGRRVVLVTMHRRENWKEAFGDVCEALIALRDRLDDIEICFVCHANPELRDMARLRLENEDRIHLMAPLPYSAFIHLLQRSVLVLTDSGGVQEEAPALGVPVLILRNTTERPEAVDEGVAQIVGTDPVRILEASVRLLTDAIAYRKMARRVTPFGDGHAAARIAQLLAVFLQPGAASLQPAAMWEREAGHG